MKLFKILNNVIFLGAMERVKQLEETSGRLRDNVWNNIVFVFHEEEVFPKTYNKKIFDELKSKAPHIFIKTCIYVVYINVSKSKMINIFESNNFDISTNDYKIYYFNTKYEISELISRTNIFVTVKEDYDRIRVLHDFIDATMCFPGVEIKGGVNYFHWNRDNRGKCK